VEDIKEARENSDFVVVYVHWGIEKATKPEEYQRNLAKAYIDAGADLVVGSHPHVLQGIEYYNSKPIVYSLGNFIFYNAIAQTAVLKVTVNEQNEATLKLLPARAENAQTSFVTLESVVTGFYKSMEEISFGIKFEPDGTVVSE
jgi:poly-gamma-glutamate synthesis protein (capsule biosynthesis protein)